MANLKTGHIWLDSFGLVLNPESLDDVAGRLYEASDWTAQAYDVFTAEEPSRDDILVTGLCLKGVARELEALGDYVYGLTAAGAAARLSARAEQEVALDEPPF